MKNFSVYLILLTFFSQTVFGATRYVDADGFKNPAHTKSYLLPTISGSTDNIVSLGATQTLTGKSLDGGSNTFTNIPLGTAVTGNLPFANLPAGGSGTTFLRGDGSWASPTGGAWGQITGTLSNQTDLATALAADLKKANNLSDLASVSAAQTNLGLGSLATVTPTGTASSASYLRGDNSWTAIAAATGVGTELLPNPTFAAGITSGWTATGLTASAVTSGANLIGPAGSTTVSLAGTAAGQTFKSAALNVQGLANGNCSAQVFYTAATAAAWSLAVTNGTTTLSTMTLPANANASTPVTITFPCGTTYSSTLQYVLTSLIASPGTLYAANPHLGSLQLFQGLQNGQAVTVTKLLSGSGSYVPPSGATAIEIFVTGGGSGGGGGNAASVAGTASTFGTLTAAGGGASGTTGAPAAGGANGTSTLAGFPGQIFKGQGGTPGYASSAATGGTGGGSFLGNAVLGGGPNGGAVVSGASAAANSGAGGGGGNWASNTAGTGFSGGGGAGGDTVDAIISAPNIASSYSYSVGSGGAGGAASGSYGAGGTGGSGQILVRESYQSVVNQAYLPSGGGLSAGDMTSTASSSCPTGTIATDGSAISRTVYASLFNAIGTTFGAGDGSTTFNLPSQPSVNAITEPVAWTPTISGFGSVTSVNAYSWRDGAFLKGRVAFVSGTPTSASAQITLGFNGVNGNVTTASTYPAAGHVVGKGNLSGFSSTFFSGMTTIAFPNNTYLNMGVETSGSSGQTANTGVNMTASGATMELNFEVQIAGWAGNSTRQCIRTVAASAAPIMVNSVISSDNSTGTTVINTSQTYTAAATIPNTIETAFANTTSTAFTLTLPDPTVNKSKKLIISKTNSGANLLTVTGNIAGTASRSTVLHAQSEVLTLQSDGTTWQFIDKDGGYRIESAYVGCTSSSSVSSQTGNWISAISNANAGSCTLSFPTGLFSTAPLCTTVGQGGSATSIIAIYSNASSTTSLALQSAVVSNGSSTVSASNAYGYILTCKGAR